MCGGGGCPDGRGCSCFCVDCDDFLYSFCVQAHKRMKTLAKHKLIDIKELATVKPTPEPIMCASHPSLPVSMYCSTCSLLICTDCIARPVTSHSLSLLTHSHASNTNWMTLSKILTKLYPKELRGSMKSTMLKKR